MLFGWPIVAAILFARLPMERAAAWSMIGGYLLLPAGLTVNPPLIPPLDKNSVIVITTMTLCLAKVGVKKGKSGLMLKLLVTAFVLAPVAATFGNSYELHIGNLSIPGYYFVDGAKNAVSSAIQVSALFIGTWFMATPKGRFELLRTFVIGMLAYSLPMLVEVRLSPQLHRWIYGYQPFAFAQQMRAGGFRPTVFLPQGLQVALFVVMALIGAIFLARARFRIFGYSAWASATYLVPLLVLCKTLGAIVYGVLIAPFALFARPSVCVKAALVVMLFICSYPALRSQSLIPVSSVAQMAQSVSSDRADSFVVRVQNEDMLMAKANLKPWFGWGGWTRQRVFSAEDSKDISITDGGWILYYSGLGWLGYIGLFGIMAASVFRLNGSIKQFDKQDALISAGLVMMLTANMIDMLPNANLTPLSFLIAGSIAGRAAKVRKPRSVAKPAVAARADKQLTEPVSA